MGKSDHELLTYLLGKASWGEFWKAHDALYGINFWNALIHQLERYRWNEEDER